MMKQWGIFTLGNEVEQTVKLVKDAGLQIFEVRELTGLEKLLYCKGNTSVDMWIVMFYATEEEYTKVINHNEMTRVE